MNLKIPSKHENVKSLRLNSTTSNLFCISEQRESRLRKRRTREIHGACQVSWLRFSAPQARATLWKLKNSLCWWTRTISNTRLHGDWINQISEWLKIHEGAGERESNQFKCDNMYCIIWKTVSMMPKLHNIWVNKHLLHYSLKDKQ